MILTIDVGNTSTACGLFEDDECVLRFRRATDINSSSDEIGIFLRSALRENGYDWQKIQKIGCCSVVPAVNHSLSRACVKYLGHEPLFIQAGIKTGLKLRYSNPKEIGADLIAAAMGAVAEYPDKNLIIIDMGTATTLSAIDKDKNYLGGMILPGIMVSHDSLISRTSQLPRIALEEPKKVIGTNTVDCIKGGILYGSAGAIDGICERMKQELGKNCTVVATGGLAPVVVPLCKTKIILDEDLLLKGLVLIYNKNI